MVALACTTAYTWFWYDKKFILIKEDIHSIFPLTEPPRFEKQAKDLKIKEDEALTLNYAVVGIPKPSVKIMKDDVERVPSDHLIINHEGKNLEIIIQNSKRDDTGVFKVIICNEVGQAEATVNVLVFGK